MERLLAFEALRILSIQVDRMLSQIDETLDRLGEPPFTRGQPGIPKPDDPRYVVKMLRHDNGRLTKWAVQEQAEISHPAAAGCDDGEERLI